MHLYSKEKGFLCFAVQNLISMSNEAIVIFFEALDWIWEGVRMKSFLNYEY